jgi:hypothetical protein
MEDNIKINLKEMRWEDMECIHLTPDGGSGILF